MPFTKILFASNFFSNLFVNSAKLITELNFNANHSSLINSDIKMNHLI